MAVNLNNIFSFSSTNGGKPPESQAPGKSKNDYIPDEEKTSQLKSLFGGLQTGSKKPKSFFLTSEGLGLFKTEESGDPATRRLVGGYSNPRRLKQSLNFIGFISENLVVVLEKIALQEDDPKPFLELQLQGPVDFELTDEFLSIEDKGTSLLLNVREKKLIFKRPLAPEDKGTGIGRPILCKTQLAFYHLSSSVSIQRYDRVPHPSGKSQAKTPPTPVSHTAKEILQEQLALESFLGPEFRQEEEITLPKGFKVTSAYVAADDRLLLMILSKKTLLCLSSRLKPEGEFVLTEEDVHEAVIKVSPDGKNALILLTNFFDATHRSYYGQNSLFLLAVREAKLAKVPVVTGAIHNFMWSKNGEEFLAFSGDMPTHAIFYNQFGEPKIELGVLYANFAKFSPDRKYLAVGATGNLTSPLLIYDNAQLKIVAEVKPIIGAKFKWLPDSRRFTFSTCQAKLKVDNQVAMFRLTGEPLTRLNLADGQLFESLYCWEGTTEKDVKFHVEPEVEKPVKARKIMNLKTTEDNNLIFKKESREIKFISEAHINEVNEEIAKEQRLRDEEAKAKAKAKQEKEAAPKVVLLQKGANFGLARPKPEDDAEGKEAQKKAKSIRREQKGGNVDSSVDPNGKEDPERPKKKRASRVKKDGEKGEGDAQGSAAPDDEEPAPTKSSSKAPKKSPKKGKPKKAGPSPLGDLLAPPKE